MKKFFRDNEEILNIVFLMGVLIPFVMLVLFALAWLINNKWPWIDINSWLGFDNKTWLSFWGSYLGVIGAAITLVVTIKKDELNRKEDLISSVLPYLTFNIIHKTYDVDLNDYKYGDDENTDKLLEEVVQLEIRGNSNNSGYEFKRNRGFFELYCKNAGLKGAINLKLLNVTTNCGINQTPISVPHLEVGDSFKFKFELYVNHNTYIDHGIKDKIFFYFSYQDILGHYYVQDIEMPYYIFCDESNNLSEIRIRPISYNRAKLLTDKEYTEYENNIFPGVGGPVECFIASVRKGE